MNPARDIRITINLAERIPQYLDFLETYATNPEWQREDVLKRATRRYEEMWLPLANELRDKDLEPPRDVKWVWHLHMLQPKHYHNYCKQRFNRVIPHKIRGTVFEERHARERTAGIWRDKYLREPYELEPALLSSADSYARHSQLATHIVELSTEHTPALVYQYALPHYRDREFREAAVERYRRFLHVWRKNVSDVQLSVPNDVLLTWRVHCMYPVEFDANMAAILGAVDAEGGGVGSGVGAEAVLDLHELSTRDMSPLARHLHRQWLEHFSEPLHVGGTGFRGTGLYSIDSFPKERVPEQKIEECNLAINDLIISDFWGGEQSFIVEAKRLGDSSFSYTSIFRREGKPGKEISSADLDKGLGSITFHAKYHRGLEFHIYSRKGRWCNKKEHHIGTVFYNPRDLCTNGSFSTQSKSVSIPKISSTDPTVKFTINIKAAGKESITLSMERGGFKIDEMPETLREFIEMQPLWDTVHGEEGDYPIITAKHSLRSKGTSNLELVADVIKCDPAELGAVMVSVLTDTGHRLVAVAHSIGSEQLPKREQVSGDYPMTLNPEQGEQAMLIRHAQGDWGVVTGRWRERAGEGEVIIALHALEGEGERGSGRGRGQREEYVVRDDEMQSMKLGDVTVDMPTGRIVLGPNCVDIGESVAKAFCAGMIFLSCQKRAVQQVPVPSLTASTRSLDSFDSNSSSKYATGKKYSVNKAAKMSKKKSRRRKMSASFTFLLASGLQMDSYYYSGTSRSTTSSRANLTDLDNVQLGSKAGDIHFSQSGTPKSDFVGAKQGLGASLSSLGPTLSSFGTNGQIGGATSKTYVQNGRQSNGGYGENGNGYSQNGSNGVHGENGNGGYSQNGGGGSGRGKQYGEYLDWKDDDGEQLMDIRL